MYTAETEIILHADTLWPTEVLIIACLVLPFSFSETGIEKMVFSFYMLVL